MRKSLSLVFALLFVGVLGAVVVAQTHENMKEKKASEEITISTDLKVGTHLLKAGRYEIACDRTNIKFSLITGAPGESIATFKTKVLEVPCQGKELAAKREHTELAMPVGADGVAVLERLYLRGSNVEHVFPN